MQNQHGFIPKHGGYQNLKSFQNAEILHDYTVEFCSRYIPSHKMADQLIGAARSGCQNIGEGSENSGTSKQTELRLLNVANGSLKELSLDYKAYLRQHGLPVWDKDDPRAKEVRNLAYKTDRSCGTYSDALVPTPWSGQVGAPTIRRGRAYIESPESAANAALCLIFQTTFLLDQQMHALQRELLAKGDVKEQFRSARNEELKRRIVYGDGPDFDEFLAEEGLRRLPNGQVTRVDKKD